MNANILLQKEFIGNSKFALAVPESIITLVENMSEDIVKSRSLYNKIFITTMESGKKIIKTWNDNADIFIDLNRKIMHFWLSIFNQK